MTTEETAEQPKVTALMIEEGNTTPTTIITTSRTIKEDSNTIPTTFRTITDNPDVMATNETDTTEILQTDGKVTATIESIDALAVMTTQPQPSTLTNTNM